MFPNSCYFSVGYLCDMSSIVCTTKLGKRTQICQFSVWFNVEHKLASSLVSHLCLEIYQTRQCIAITHKSWAPQVDSCSWSIAPAMEQGPHSSGSLLLIFAIIGESPLTGDYWEKQGQPNCKNKCSLFAFQEMTTNLSFFLFLFML